MQLLCKYQGGSHAYGLTTPTSDVDNRGVFVNTELSKLVGLDKHEHQEDRENGNDDEYKEFRAFLLLLSQANTNAVESLFMNESQFEVLSDEFKLVRSYRERLVDSERLYKCLKGYMQGELKLANGERTGKLGGKRKEAIDKYGFSPKNFVQLFRLGWAGCYFFDHGVFPVKVSDYDPAFHHFLMEVKVSPQNFTKEYLNRKVGECELLMFAKYENRKKNFVFDRDLANELCYQVYYPYIRDAQRQMKILQLLPPKVKL